MVTATARSRTRRRRTPFERAWASWTRVGDFHRGRVEAATTPGRRLAYLAGWMWASLRRLTGREQEEAIVRVTSQLTRIAEELHEGNRPS